MHYYIVSASSKLTRIWIGRRLCCLLAERDLAHRALFLYLKRFCEENISNSK